MSQQFQANRAAARLFKNTEQLQTLGQWLSWTVAAFERLELASGQVAAEAHDDALFLLLRTFDLPLDSKPPVLRRRLDVGEIALLKTILTRRLLDRVPSAYLAREAWLGEHRFYVDERVIIPRSYFLELIGKSLDQLLAEQGIKQVKRAVDVCTGSGCLAILLAHHFPRTRVDGVDLSAEALEVATINLKEHELTDRVRLHLSDVFDAVPSRRYEVILSNPPYEPSAICDDLPAEFKREPRMALDGGPDGLVIVRKLLRQARERLTSRGLLLIEVGELKGAMEASWPDLEMRWLEVADGSESVCVITAGDLKRAKSVG